MKIKLSIILLLISSYGFACTCFPIEKKDVNRILKQADFAIVGTAVENIEVNDTLRFLMNESKQGVEVKIKIDQVLKGTTNSQFVLVNQFSNGNCVRVFEFGKQYVIVGDQIREFIDRSPPEEVNTPGEIPTSLPPPPVSELANNNLYCYDIDKTSIEYWNTLAKTEIIIYSSQCITFHPTSEYGKHFIKQSKKSKTKHNKKKKQNGF